MLRPSAIFRTLIARAGLEPKDIIARAHISRTTYFAWLNPSIQPNRKGGMRLSNAWSIARVYADAAQVTEDAAFNALFVEVDDTET